MASETLFADRILNISIQNGLVRIDLGTVDTYLDGEERKQRTELTQRLVMPVDGFVRSFAMQQRMVNQLNERAKQAQGAAAEADAPASTGA
jgi:hypothetical protein